MQKTVYDRFVNDLIPLAPPPGPRILEIGANAPATSLLNALGDPAWSVQIDIEEPSAVPTPYRKLQMDANAMSFDDESFDAVVCVGVLNNDPHFWRALAEIRRVLVSGGVFYFHSPRFSQAPRKLALKRRLYRLSERTGRQWPIRLAENTWLTSVPTYHFSPTPADYYRFSEAAAREVILDGFDVLHTEEALYPPRILAVGRKP